AIARLRSRIVPAAQVEEPVADVEDELVARAVAELAGDPVGALGRNHDLAGDVVVRVVEIERNDVRRLVMVEELAVDALDLGVVDDRDRDRKVATLAFLDELHQSADEAVVEGDPRVTDGDLDGQAAATSGGSARRGGGTACRNRGGPTRTRR